MEREPSHWGGQDARVAVSLTQARLSVPRAGRDSGTFLDREGAGPWVQGWDLTLQGCSLHQCLCFALHVGPVLSCCTQTFSPVGKQEGQQPQVRTVLEHQPISPSAGLSVPGLSHTVSGEALWAAELAATVHQPHPIF